MKNFIVTSDIICLNMICDSCFATMGIEKQAMPIVSLSLWWLLTTYSWLHYYINHSIFDYYIMKDSFEHICTIS